MPSLRTCLHLLLLCSFVLLAGCAPPPQPGAPAPPPFEFVGEWGVPGSGPGQLENPSGIAVDAFNNVFISDSGSNFVHKFTPTGTPLLAFQSPGLGEAACIALDAGSAIYVCDRRNRSLRIFYPNGDFLRTLRFPWNGAPLAPRFAAVAADGTLFVADERLRMARWGPEARPEPLPAGEASGERPAPVAGGLHVSSGGELFALDAAASEMHVRRRIGQRKFAVEIIASSSSTARYAGNAFALSAQHAIISFPQRKTLGVWTLDGRFVRESNLGGRLAVKGEEVRALAVSPKGELFLLITRGEARIPAVLRYGLRL